MALSALQLLTLANHTCTLAQLYSCKISMHICAGVLNEHWLYCADVLNEHWLYCHIYL